MYCDYLIEFVAVARNHSFSKAALELSVSQSSLSRHMKSLESQLNVDLLTRHKDGVELTDMGRYIYNRAGDIVDAVEDIDFYARAHADTQSIVVGGMSIFPALIQALMEQVKDLGEKFTIKEDMPSDFDEEGITRTLSDHELDIYVTLSSDRRLQNLDSSYDQILCITTPVVAIMEATHPLVKEIPLTAHDLSGQTLLHAQSDFDGEVINWEDTKHLLREFNVDYHSKTCSLDNKTDMLVNLGNEVILLPEAYSGIDMLRKAGKMVTEIDGFTKQIVCVYKKDSKHSDALHRILTNINVVFSHSDSVIYD